MCCAMMYCAAMMCCAPTSSSVPPPVLMLCLLVCECAYVCLHVHARAQLLTCRLLPSLDWSRRMCSHWRRLPWSGSFASHTSSHLAYLLDDASSRILTHPHASSLILTHPHASSRILTHPHASSRILTFTTLRHARLSL